MSHPNKPSGLALTDLRDALRACAKAIEPVGDLSGFPGTYEDLPRDPPPLISYEHVRELRELVAEGAVTTCYVPEVVAAAIDGIHAPVWIDRDAYTRTPAPNAQRRPDDIQPMPALPSEYGEMYDPDADVGMVAEESDASDTPDPGAPHGGGGDSVGSVGSGDTPDMPDDPSPGSDGFDDDEEGEATVVIPDNLPSEASTVLLRESTGEVDAGKAAAAAGAAGAFGMIAAVLSMILVIGLVVLAALGYSIADTSAREMRVTEAELVQAEHDLESVLQTEARLIELLVGRGADRARLEKAYFDFQDATDKAEAGLEYGDVLEKQYSAVTSRYGADEQIERSWRQIEARMNELEARRERAAAARQGLGPVLAGALGM